jgi:bifunctional DNA-binding transcriptional regulator/antitoxin component of YhaV-PrlF toxin-antitoxin module
MKRSTNTIKLTGKNQLTVPAEAARQLKLQSGDFLQYELRAGTLVLSPRPTIKQRLQDVWADNAKANKGAASDESIKQTLGDFHSNQNSRP